MSTVVKERYIFDSFIAIFWMIVTIAFLCDWVVCYVYGFLVSCKSNS